ncbi:hypothetical protein JDN40_13175 [Rhodomicrobium vannielii ATCC 17100]|uniref:hypothetical protein n=1 Tax=Rhodomicrobium vannielii TaxID=1069 RepID=UPI00191A016A|nr:hypothetical protein [Rhodomicrobium vannielii]MBJ7535061.1 hypothetical protein [Rhodomicrobium vannielii ATCC 17100]
MGTVDLGKLKGNQVVIHYGGKLTSVDAYTFANSLISFADTIRAINQAIDPKQEIEVRVEAIDTGSFRAVIRRIPKGFEGLFSKRLEDFLWTLLCTFIIERVILNDPKTVINISSDQVIIETDGSKYIIPRAAFDQAEQLKKNPEIQKKLSKTFEVVGGDPAIENFGITPSVKDESPLFQVPSEEFQKISLTPALLPDGPNEDSRTRTEKVTLVILKAWLRRGSAKWAFEWNGHPISAPIKDLTFFERLERREILIGAGDALDVDLSFTQNFDVDARIYVNDPSTFVVERVHKPISRSVQLSLDD